MTVRKFAYVVSILLMASFVDLPAQFAQVKPGERVRITAPTFASKLLVGTVVSVDTDTLRVKLKGGISPVMFPFSSLKSLEVSRSTKPMVAEYAGLGALTGGGAAVLITVLKDQRLYQGYTSTIGAAAGAAVGALIGLVIRTEEWERVQFEQISRK